MEQFSPVVQRRETNDSARRRCTQVLVVDDYEDNAESMATLLRLYGHEVDTALSGTSAVNAARCGPRKWSCSTSRCLAWMVSRSPGHSAACSVHVS